MENQENLSTIEENIKSLIIKLAELRILGYWATFLVLLSFLNSIAFYVRSGHLQIVSSIVNAVGIAFVFFVEGMSYERQKGIKIKGETTHLLVLYWKLLTNKIRLICYYESDIEGNLYVFSDKNDKQIILYLDNLFL